MTGATRIGGLIAAVACTVPALGVTKDDLIAEIEDRRAAIQDLYVEFVFYANGQVPASAVRRDARTVVLKGSDKIRIDRAYGIDLVTFETGASFNGARGWGHQAVNKKAYTRQGADIPLLDTRGSGFFDLMMWYPCTVARGEGQHPSDLVSVLESEYSQLLGQTEVINGHECHVLEVRYAGATMSRIWIDPEWGYLPVQQAYYDTCISVNPVVDFTISAAIELIEDVWLPTSGQRVTTALPNVPDLANGMQYTMAVQQDASGWRLEVNKGVDDATFDLSASLPPGTLVSDLDSGQIWMANARDYGQSADTALAMLPSVRPRTPLQAEPIDPWSLFSTSNIGWLALVILAGLSGAGALFLQERRA